MSSQLPSLSTREVIVALKKLGFIELPARGKGSHVFMRNPLSNRAVTIPERKDVRRGTLRAILRDADVTVPQFIEAHRS